MASWKQILLKDDVTGSGVITVSSTVPHNVVLGDPVVTTTALSSIANDDKLLIWDESDSVWRYINYSSANINLGNSDLTQSDTNRTFDIANAGSLTFIGNNGATLNIKSENSSGVETVRTIFGQNIESYSNTNPSFGGMKISSASSSSDVLPECGVRELLDRYGIWLEGGYKANDRVDAPNLIAFERVYNVGTTNPTDGDEIGVLEFYGATSTQEGLGDGSTLQSTYNGEGSKYAKIVGGISTANNTTPTGFLDLGSYKIVTLVDSSKVLEFSPALHVDIFGVRINAPKTLGGTDGCTPTNTNSDFYLPTGRGTDGQVLTTNGSGATSWKTVSGGGGVDVIGSPAEDHIAIFHDEDTLKSSSALSWFPGTSTLRVTDGFVAVDGVDFDTTATPALVNGRLAYDTDKETLIFQGANGEITLGETYKAVYNDTGSTILKGTAVKAVGVNGEQFKIAPFDADVDEVIYFIGVTQGDIADEESGIVVSEGVIKHLNTSSYSIGQILYTSSTAGGLTTTAPTPPAVAIPVAMVTKVDATNGQIYVRPTWFPKLNDLLDVSASGPGNNSILQYNAANSRYQLTTSPTFASLTTTGTATLAGLYASSTSIFVGQAVFNGGLITNSLDFTGNGTSTIGISTLLGTPDNLEIRSNGNVEVKLDYNNDESAKAFKVIDGGGTTRFAVVENGKTEINGIAFPAGTPTVGQTIHTNSAGELIYAKTSINQLFTQVTSVTITTGSWSASGSFYKSTISNANITATSIVDIIPDNGSYQTVLDAVILPKTDSAAGSVDVFAVNIPAANITCTLNILETAATW